MEARFGSLGFPMEISGFVAWVGSVGSGVFVVFFWRVERVWVRDFLGFYILC